MAACNNGCCSDSSRLLKRLAAPADSLNLESPEVIECPTLQAARYYYYWRFPIFPGVRWCARVLQIPD